MIHLQGSAHQDVFNGKYTDPYLHDSLKDEVDLVENGIEGMTWKNAMYGINLGHSLPKI